MNLPSLLRTDRRTDPMTASHVKEPTPTNPRENYASTELSTNFLWPEQNLSQSLPGSCAGGSRITVEILQNPTLDFAKGPRRGRRTEILRRIKLPDL